MSGKAITLSSGMAAATPTPNRLGGMTIHWVDRFGRDHRANCQSMETANAIADAIKATNPIKDPEILR